MTPRNLNEQAATWAQQIQKPATGASDGHFSWQAVLAVTAAHGSTPEAFLTSIRNGDEIAIGEAKSHAGAVIHVKILKELRLLARPSGFAHSQISFSRFKWISKSHEYSQPSANYYGLERRAPRTRSAAIPRWITPNGLTVLRIFLSVPLVWAAGTGHIVTLAGLFLFSCPDGSC